MIRRGALCTVLVAVAALTGTSDAAHASDRTYLVIKCHVFSRSSSEVGLEANGPYSSVDSCAGPDQRFEMTESGFGLPGQAGSIRLTAPGNTSIVGVALDANLRRDNHHLAQLSVVDDSGISHVLANGDDSGSGFQQYSFSGLSDRHFVAQLVCGDPGGCPSSAQAHAFVKNIGLTLADRADPGVTGVGGSLFDAGWARGPRVLLAEGADLGSGIASVWVLVNGTEAGRTAAPCSSVLGVALSGSLVPCPMLPASVHLGALTMDTARSPFVEGANQIAVCVTDFAGNGPVCTSDVVHVDNLPPSLSFTQGDPADPELIRAAALDAHSGLDPQSARIAYRLIGASEWTPLPTKISDSALLARVDSGAATPGAYEFSAAVADVAGNLSQTAVRSDGEPMILNFPLREPVQLVARIGHGDTARETIGYGHDSKAHGRLLDGDGQPMADRKVTVTEYFGAGALIDRRVRTVTTNERGRWGSLLPAGPSRAVTVAFEGTPRYQPREAASRELRVRSRSSFAPSQDRVREGRGVTFEGKVGHFGARIPAGGKLIELQVREARGRWNTVREAFHTDSSGRFSFRYRFGRFYDSNAHFVFRVKVAREQGWPYKAPGRSRSRTVTVVANR